MADYIQEIRALVGNKRLLLNGCCALVFDAEVRLLLAPQHQVFADLCSGKPTPILE